MTAHGKFVTAALRDLRERLRHPDLGTVGVDHLDVFDLPQLDTC